MHFVIIGGDAAGMSAASRAKRHHPDLKVTVLEKTDDVSYSACGMPYAIGDPNRKMNDLVVRQADVFRQKQGINLLTGHTAEAIDPAAQQVQGTTAAGETFAYGYDRLLIATGASALMPDLPGMNLPGVMCLKSLEEGRRIKNHITATNVEKAVIIGMGYIALEMCEALRGLGIAVDMIKPGPILLPWLHADLSAVVLEQLNDNDVGVSAGQKVHRIEKENGRLVVVADNKRHPADMVLVAIGIAPNSQMAEAAGLDLSVGRSISVDSSLRTSQPHIYAAGDCADAIHVVTGKKTWIPLALRANRAGWAVADNVCGKTVALPGIVGTAVFRVFNLEVARTGLTPIEAAETGFDPASVVIKAPSRAHNHPGSSSIYVHMVGDRKSGKLLGCQMVGRDGVAHRINAPAVALMAKLTVAEYVQSDLAYAPPFGPTWDPTLTAANQLIKKL